MCALVFLTPRPKIYNLWTLNENYFYGCLFQTNVIISLEFTWKGGQRGMGVQKYETSVLSTASAKVVKT